MHFCAHAEEKNNNLNTCPGVWILINWKVKLHVGPAAQTHKHTDAQGKISTIPSVHGNSSSWKFVVLGGISQWHDGTAGLFVLAIYAKEFCRQKYKRIS